MTEAVICSANKWTGFCMITASVMKELNICGEYEIHFFFPFLNP